MQYTFLLFNFKISIAISEQTKPRAAESRHIFIFYIFQGGIISLLPLSLHPLPPFPFAINIQAISLFAVISKQNDKSYNHISLYHGDQRRTITRLGSRVGTINNPTPIFHASEIPSSRISMQGGYYLSWSANATRFPSSFILSNPARCERFVKMKNSTLLLRVGLPFLSRSSAVASPPSPPLPFISLSLSFFLRRNQ